MAAISLTGMAVAFPVCVGLAMLIGGGVDPQKTLPFGTPQEVAAETKRNVKVLSKGGGFVCAAVHNIQGPTPVENILAFFEAINA